MAWNRKPKQDLEAEPQQVLPAALRYLGRRDYTAAELRERLSRRGAAAAAIEEALVYLSERNYLDEKRTAAAHIRERLRFAPRGRALVRQELLNRGLAPPLVEEMLAEHYAQELERETLRRFLRAQKIVAVTEPEEQQRRWLKLARRAAAKGFATELIMSELEQWRAAAGEEEQCAE